MSKIEKILMLLLSGRSDTNFEFTDLITLLKRLGFTMRIKGSHHIFYRDDIDEIINLQPDKNKAKPYQVKQIRILILKFDLKIDNDE
ncbi:MAG TPA: type II toxin-antitoxin system HicA family toxin [Prolixibacteraceae bacterium]|nr:type II toxin-antitoxin system HicA family toxin [Prolixibacteraceae bacterium]